MSSPATLGRLLEHQANTRPDATFVRCWQADDDIEVLTFRQTWALACRWADLLRDRGVTKGDPVVLALPNGIDFVGAFFATQLLGARPAASPAATDETTAMEIAARAQRLGTRVVVSHPRAEPLPAKLTTLTHGDLSDQVNNHSPDTDGDAVAVLQFTSGTAGPAKIVALTHRAIMAQLEYLSKALQLDDERDSAVSWLPLFHDMGLIGFLLVPAFLGRHVTLFDSRDFAARPALWAQLLSDTKATVTGGPPSAFALCARRTRAAEAERLDLRHLRIALIGAETVTRPSLDLFLRRFSPRGVEATSLVPTYGLAENCLAVTMPPLARAPLFDPVNKKILRVEGRAESCALDNDDCCEVASVGAPLSGLEVAIVDPGGNTLPDRTVGEITVTGPTVMAGYLDDDTATRDVLCSGRLCTGDLGYLADGELFVTGRKKELIIVGGRNYAPEAYETVASAVPGIRGGRTVAFSVDDPGLGTEHVVLAAETSLTDDFQRQELLRTLQRAVAEAGLPIDETLLLEPRSIRLTPTGKIRRVEWKERYLAGEFSS